MFYFIQTITQRIPPFIFLISTVLLAACGGDSSGVLSIAGCGQSTNLSGSVRNVGGSLATARDTHTATLLPSGKVLITGGCNGKTAVAGAELYDPETSNFTATGSLIAARGIHTATLLQNGKVLIVGGGSDTADLASAELYDPVTGTFNQTGSLATAREGHTATVIPPENNGG